MEALREQELRQFAPHIIPTYLNALVQGWGEMERAGINTPLRVSHFLAQMAHETDGFTILREYTNWTAAQMCRLWPSRFKTQMDPRIASCRGDPEALANLAYSNRKGSLGE
jgi:Predicted chitinase